MAKKDSFVSPHLINPQGFKSYQFYVILFFVSSGALGAGYIAEYGFGLKPCALCWYQRYAYMASAFISLILTGLFYKRFNQKKAMSHLINIMGLMTLFFAFAINCFFAVYQVFVEQKWITQPSLCKGVEIDTLNQTFEQFEAQLKQMGNHVPCDQIPWELFGISMAGYNALFTFALSMILLNQLQFLVKSKTSS